MAENYPIAEGGKVYPKRLAKTLYDEETWETCTYKKKQTRKNRTSEKDSTKQINKQSNINNLYCRKCLQVFAEKMELMKHEETCLIRQKKESFLKHHPRKMDDPIVLLEKIMVPSSQPTADDSENQEAEKSADSSAPQTHAAQQEGRISAHTKTDTSYAEATKGTLLSPEKRNNVAPQPLKTQGPILQKQVAQNKQQQPKNRKPAKKNAHKNPTEDILTTTNQVQIQNDNDLSEINQPSAETEVIVESSTTITEENAVSEAYEEIVKWKRNLFDIPKGNLGKRFIEEMTKHLNNWTATNENKSLQLAMVMPSLLLQRTAKSCKGRVNKENLQRRFELWESGKLNELVEEGKCLQSRLTAVSGNKNEEETLVTKFRNHMLRGNVNAALRLLSSSGKSGLLNINEETIEQLHEKHPEGEEINDVMLLQGPEKYVHPVIFDEMNEDLVQKVAMKTRGAAGPSNFDASDWRSMLVSRVHGTSSTDLCRAIVNVAKKLCTENVNQRVEALMACRLIPLDKNPGLRPIGIGEVLRRIIGKMVVSVLRADLQENVGDLQLCAGQKSGCEAGIHAMSDIYHDADTHGIIQVDANNAFNTINRKMFLHNIKLICPEISIFIINCYQQPARLFVVGGIEILSQEGTTQGDPSAMYVYGLGLMPLILALSVMEVRLSAFADDLAGGGTLEQLRNWWDQIIYLGQFIGYTAKPSKSWLIVKAEYYQQAVEKFEGTGIRITMEGKRHLGAVVGSLTFKSEYVKELIDGWIEELKNLNKIARVEPHVAYSAYIFGFQHKFTYFLRTIPNISDDLKRLDKAIDEQLLKPIFDNYEFNYSERQWYSLPPRKGGLGIIIPSEVSDTFYQNSRHVTENLVSRIVNQHQPAESMENDAHQRVTQIIRTGKAQREDDKLAYVKSTLDPKKMKILEAISEKGASNWLTTMPIREHGFYLNKQEFWDSIRTRYGIALTRLPSQCAACGVPFNVEHAFSCKYGGFVTIRHNEIRDFTAEVLREVSQNVEVEPLLTPLTGEHLRYRTANTDDQARLDVSARGVWARGSKAFFDVRVFNPLAPSYRNQTLSAAHKSNENEKKRKYRQRIQNVEHGSFTPLVFTSFGGMSIECLKFFNHISDKISDKRNIAGSLARTWVRTKLCFSLLRTANLCIRGSKSAKPQNIVDLSSTHVQAAVSETRMDVN